MPSNSMYVAASGKISFFMIEEYSILYMCVCMHVHNHIFFIHSSVDEHLGCSHIISSVQLLSRVPLFVTPWTVARQASLSITNSRSLLKLISI